MKTFLCAIGLALALPALAQTNPQPELPPLVPAQPAQPAPARKKKAAKKPDAPSASKEQPELPPLALPDPNPPAKADLPLPLPPLAPLAAKPPPRPVVALGVAVQGGALPIATSARVEQGLRAVARMSPTVKDAPGLLAHACTDDPCWASAGAAQSLDHVAVADYASGTLRLRIIDVEAKKQVAEVGQQAGSGLTEVTAAGEALMCRLLVPAGCTGQASVDTADGVEVDIDGQKLAKGEKRKLPVGLHALNLRSGTKVSGHTLPVLHADTPTLYARVVDGEPRLLSAADLAPRPAVPVAAVAASAPPQQERKWTKTAAYVTAGAAVATAAAGAYFGLKSKSDISQAESAFNSNGGAYRPADLTSLESGNSKAHTANALFIASGVLLATAAVFTFAF